MATFKNSMVTKVRQLFPKGARIILQKRSKTGTRTFMTTEIVGTVLEWKCETTGAWYAKNGDPSIQNNDGKLELLRLLLEKIDGEITDIVMDDLTTVNGKAKLPG